MHRRKFLAGSSLSLLGLPHLMQLANEHLPTAPTLAEGSTILFQGDSITDAQRAKDRYYPNDGRGMGSGYVHQTVTTLLGEHPDKKLRCYNRGISGHKVFQLANRWEDDCLQLEPDVLSILIGVNDFWHTVDWGYDGTVQVYEKDYRALLDRTKMALPNVQLIIAEPFALRGTAIKEDQWFPAFYAYQRVAKSIAEDYQATFIPLQSIFDNALKLAPISYWAPDGVHPTLAGAHLMAEAWLAAIKL